MLGQHDDLAVELAAAAARHPLQERLWGQYLVALYRAGRRTDALRAYGQLCVRMESELGVRPCAQLRGLHREIHAAAAVTLRTLAPGHAGMRP
jgi:DNA-binding SARP family transcriptional activator